MNLFDKQYEQLEEDGHIVFHSDYDYNRFVNALSDRQKENLILDKAQLTVWLEL